MNHKTTRLFYRAALSCTLVAVAAWVAAIAIFCMYLLWAALENEYTKAKTPAPIKETPEVIYQLGVYENYEDYVKRGEDNVNF